MQQVWKYELGPERTDVEMPAGAYVLSAQGQGAQPPEAPRERGWATVWALVDPAAESETRTFFVTGTGHAIAYERDALDFIGTVQWYDGSLVLHVFEVTA